MTSPSTSLEALRRFLSWHPWHFWQLAHSTLAPITKECSDIIMEYAWQSADAIGRSEMRRSLADAERILMTWLRFPVVPTSIEHEVHPYTRGPIQLHNGKILALGAKVDTLIGQITPTFMDADGDGLNERWTATIATTATDASSLVVRIRTNNQPEGARDDQDRWNIETTVTISGGIATISGSSWLLVKPMLYERTGAQALDLTDAATFITSLDVFVRTYDSTAVANYTRNGVPVAGPTSGSWSIVNAKNGAIRFSSTCGYAWECNGYPTHISISYLAGDQTGDWNSILCKLALAEMARPICGCTSANREVERWQRDYSISTADRFQMRTTVMDNQLGTREGHAAAWEAIQKNKRMIGVLASR